MMVRLGCNSIRPIVTHLHGGQGRQFRTKVLDSGSQFRDCPALAAELLRFMEHSVWVAASKR